MEIILVRHSIAQGNPERRFLGVTDTPLLPEGIALAERRAAAMPPVEHVYVSPLRRARETAALLWPCIPETIVPGLREMDFGAFENRTHAELVAANDRAYLEWLAQERWDGYPGGETYSAMRMRVAAAFEDSLFDADRRGCRRVGMVAHGGTILFLLERYTDVRTDFGANRTENCGGFFLNVERSREGVRFMACMRLENDAFQIHG